MDIVSKIFQTLFWYRGGDTGIIISIFACICYFVWPSHCSQFEFGHTADEETSKPKKRACLGTETAKDGTVWREEQLGTSLPFTPIEAYAADGEPTAKARKSISSHLQSFLCFITLDMLHSIQEWTIQHAQQTEHVHWFMDLPELMAFIAIVILRGVIRVPSLRDCWSANLGNPQIIGTMPRNRFQDIMRHLRFDDMSTRSDWAKTDKFAAISSVWGSFVTNCITCYNPGLHITVDEQLFPSKTRCCFLQYIASKPDKFGIKFWVACDLKSKYICNVLPYLGKDPNRPSGERLSENVVMRLMEPFLDKGRNVTTDNFFTSLSLAQKLLRRKTTILGTVNKIRREIPQSARHTDRNEFTTQVCCRSFVVLCLCVSLCVKVLWKSQFILFLRCFQPLLPRWWRMRPNGRRQSIFLAACTAWFRLITPPKGSKHCHPLQHHKVWRGCDGPDGAGVHCPQRNMALASCRVL